MIINRYRFFARDKAWSRVSGFSVIIFFVFLGDAILSYWVPNLLERSLGNPLKMGLVLSFSSIIGFGADLVLPQLMRGLGVAKLLSVGIVVSLLFSVLLILSIPYPVLVIFIASMAVWGFYYEFLGFASHQFVADSVPLKLRSSSWAFISVFKNLSYFLGPIIGGLLIFRSEYFPPLAAILFTLTGWLILLLIGSRRRQAMDVNIKEINLKDEVEHWWTLSKSVWPALVMSLMIGLIDAFFWSVGAVWTEKLAEQNILGGFFLPFYTLPSLFMGFVVVRMGIYKGKKRVASEFLFVAGVFLAFLGFSGNAFWQLAIVFISSMMLAVVYPMLDAVYSDIVARMGREKKHLIGLINAVISVSYIIGPALAGFLSNSLGEMMTFTAIGIATAVVSGILIFVTPKKLLLPQAEIQDWE